MRDGDGRGEREMEKVMTLTPFQGSRALFLQPFLGSGPRKKGEPIES